MQPALRVIINIPRVIRLIVHKLIMAIIMVNAAIVTKLCLLAHSSLTLLAYMICMVMYWNGSKTVGIVITTVRQAMVKVGSKEIVRNEFFAVAHGSIQHHTYVQYLETGLMHLTVTSILASVSFKNKEFMYCHLATSNLDTVL